MTMLVKLMRARMDDKVGMVCVCMCVGLEGSGLYTCMMGVEGGRVMYVTCIMAVYY